MYHSKKNDEESILRIFNYDIFGGIFLLLIPMCLQT